MANTPNRLLAMLNSAAASPAPTPSQQQNASSSGQHRATALSPNAAQAVSLADLFKSIAPPLSSSTSTAPSPAPALVAPASPSAISTLHEPVVGHPHPSATPSVGKEDQQNRLLGMLRNIGVPSPNPQPSLRSGSPSSASASVPASSGPQAGTQQSATMAGSKQRDLLAMLKSPLGASAPALPSPAVQPDVAASTQASGGLQVDGGGLRDDVPSTGGPVEIGTDQVPHPDPVLGDKEPGGEDAIVAEIKNDTAKANSSVKVEGSTSNGPTSSAAPIPPATAPQKSIFHFVSPFDAFGPTPSRSVSQATKTADRPATPKEEAKKAVSVDSPGAASRKPESVSGSTPDVKPSKAELAELGGPPTVPQIPKAAVVSAGATSLTNGEIASRIALPPQAGNARSSQAGQTASKAETAGFIADFRVGTITSGAKGSGPKATGAHIHIDVSKPNLDSLISDRNAVQVIPTAVLKPLRAAGFHAGRVVGITQGWIAYGLSGGRLRLIDRASGARIILQLPERAAKGPIIDMSVTATSVAAVGADHSVTVFRVPKAWTKDDPPCQQILHLSGVSEQLGALTKVEWVDRGVESLLAIAGSAGVALFHPQREGETTNLEQLGKNNKILSTEGDIVSFCFNHTQQAIAILSTSLHLTIYSVATLNRVYHKRLPSSEGNTTPCSIAFCETNILIGYNSNTSFDLVQITLNLAVLGTIRFTTPGSPPESSYSHAVYDPHNALLWMTSYPRGSIYGLKYALKGLPPVSDVASIVPFTTLGEIPLEQVSCLVVAREQSEATEIIFAHPKGVSLGLIGNEVVEALSKPISQAEPMSAAEQAQVGGTLDSQPEAEVSPTIPSTPLTMPPVEPIPSTGQSAFEARDSAPVESAASVDAPPVTSTAVHAESIHQPSVPGPQRNRSAQSPAASKAAQESDDEPVIIERESVRLSQEVAKQLKKTEDRINTQFRQALSSQIGTLSQRFDGIGGDKLAGDVASKVERQLRGTLNNVVRDEIKKTVLPTIANTVQTEVRAAIANSVGPAIKEAVQQGMPAELERAIRPALEQAISKSLRQALDRAIQDAMAKVVIPSISQSTVRMVEGLSAELKSELVQLRKDLSPASPDRHDQALKSMSESLLELQRQMSALTEQVRSAPPAPALGPHFAHHPPLHPAVGQHIPMTAAPPLPPPPPPPAQQLEDTFLAALSSVSVGDTISLINTHYALTDYCLPINPTSRPPLSQAVMLTLFHRLALALSELAVNTADPIFARAINWERRVAALLDPRVPEMRDYYPRVVDVVKSTLGAVIVRLGPDPATRALREILDVVSQSG